MKKTKNSEIVGKERGHEVQMVVVRSEWGDGVGFTGRGQKKGRREKGIKLNMK